MAAPGPNEWGKWVIELYTSRRGPQPLGTVIFDEIEAKAKEVLKNSLGQ